MRTIRGHFDGRCVVLDEPVPPDLVAQTPVKILIDENGTESLIGRLTAIAGSDDLPADYSEQFEHYTKGTPRK